MNIHFPLAALMLSGAASLATSVVAETSYPVSIEHAFGTTTITAKPARVATVAWQNHETPLALGVVPVGFPAVSWGDDNDDGIFPWVEERLDALGAETPTLFNESDGIDFEAVAASDPDVILASYSGLSQEDYDLLSEIAPVVAYPDGAWTTDWRTGIRLNSAGLGLAEEGEELVASLEAQINDVAAQHPSFAEQRVMFISHTDTNDLSVVRFYAADDPRVSFFTELGLELADAVAATKGTSAYSGEFSAEQIDAFDDVTLVVTYADEELLKAMKADPLLSKMPAVANGSFLYLPESPLSAAANPNALSLPWSLEQYADLIAGAVAGDD